MYGGECCTRRAVHALESLQAGEEYDRAPSGKTHQNDSFRVDSRMLCEQFEGAVGVADLGQRAELGLIVRRTHNATPGEAIHFEGRDPQPVEPLAHASTKLTMPPDP
jgi:hypothetical protein